MIKIKPSRPKLLVRMPDGRRLPDEGAQVAESSYWLRRLRSRDVVKYSTPQVEAEPQPMPEEGEE